MKTSMEEKRESERGGERIWAIMEAEIIRVLCRRGRDERANCSFCFGLGRRKQEAYVEQITLALFLLFFFLFFSFLFFWVGGRGAEEVTKFQAVTNRTFLSPFSFTINQLTN